MNLYLSTAVKSFKEISVSCLPVRFFYDGKSCNLFVTMLVWKFALNVVVDNRNKKLKVALRNLYEHEHSSAGAFASVTAGSKVQTSMYGNIFSSISHSCQRHVRHVGDCADNGETF